MTRNEIRNRANKAVAIADTLTAVHCDADTATALTTDAWAIAAQAAAERTGHSWVACSPATQAAVVAILVDRETPAAVPVPVEASDTTKVLAAVVTALVEVDGGYEPPLAPGSLRVDPQPAAEEPACDHPNIAYCDTCDPDPETRQRDEAAGR